jgi:hypothetical protein
MSSPDKKLIKPVGEYLSLLYRRSRLELGRAKGGEVDVRN